MKGDLLLKDLCARVSYGVKFHYFSEFADGEDPEFDNTIAVIDIADEQILDEDHEDYIPIRQIMPYLRPMSSMTEEEKEEMHNLLSPEGTAIYENNGISLPINHYGEFVSYEFMNRIIQYLLEHYFDFMGLIPKGLAIEVTENNNPYKD